MDLGGRYILRKAEWHDAFAISVDLRLDDKWEWSASVKGGASIDNIAASIEASAEVYAVADAGTYDAHILFGVVPVPEPTTWMMGTERGQRDCAWIWQASREWADAFWQRWPKTVCYSAPFNTVHHRWLEWIGYRHVRDVPWGPYKAIFKEYRKEL